MQQPRNPEMPGLITGIVIAAAGAAAMLAPFITGMDMMDWGYGTMCIGGFVLLVGLITAWVYRARVAAAQGLLAGENLLAQWSYTEPAGEQLIEEQFAEYTGHNKALFLIVAAWFVVIGGGCLAFTYLTEDEFMWPLALIFLGVVLLIGAVAYLAPRIERNRARRAARDVYIGRKGIMVQGALHAWGTPLERLDAVAYEATSQGGELQFTLSSLSSVGVPHYESRSVRVPVPAGHEEAARAAARQLQEQIAGLRIG